MANQPLLRNCNKSYQIRWNNSK